MSNVSKSELVEHLLPTDILEQASKIVVNEQGQKLVIKDKEGVNEDKIDTITITYNISLDAALASFEHAKSMKNFGSAKARL